MDALLGFPTIGTPMASAPTFGFSGLGAATNRLTTSPSMAGLETMLMAQNQLILQLMTMLVQLMGAQGGSSPVGGLDSAGGSALSSPSGGGSTSSSGGSTKFVTMYAPIVEFTHDGKKVKFTSSLGLREQIPTGSSVPVRYLPSDPETSAEIDSVARCDGNRDFDRLVGLMNLGGAAGQHLVADDFPRDRRQRDAAGNDAGTGHLGRDLDLDNRGNARDLQFVLVHHRLVAPDDAALLVVGDLGLHVAFGQVQQLGQVGRRLERVALQQFE